MLNNLNQTSSIHTIVTIGSFLILAIGLIGVFSKKNLFKIFLSFAIVESALFIYFIGMHFEVGKIAPIINDSVKNFDINIMVDPVPQAMILTTIVIAIAVLALALSFVINYFKLTNNIDINKMDELGEEK
jgi:multisubunit Na+/H+ antiporter MnhC subunit